MNKNLIFERLKIGKQIKVINRLKIDPIEKNVNGEDNNIAMK